MEVSISSPKDWLREIAVELEPERLKAKVSEMIAAYGPKAEVPGFRKGRVPQHVIEKRLGPALESAAVEELVGTATEEALKGQTFLTASLARVEELEVTPEKSVKFTVKVEVIPEFALKSYTGLKLSREEPEDFDGEFEKRLADLQDRCATFRSVARPALDRDFVSCDYRMLDGDKVLGEPRTNVMLQVGNPTNFPEVNAALVGANPGEERSAEVTFPADYHDKAVAGRRIVFSFKVREVKKKEMPEVSEEFAQDLGFESLDAMRQDLNDQILADRARVVAAGLRSQVFAHLVKEHDFEPPESWVQASFTQIASEFPPTDDVEIRQKMARLAVQRAKFEVVASRIAEEEKIDVTEEEIRTRIEEFAKNSGRPIEEVADVLSSPAYRRTVLSEKVLSFIVEKADVA